MNQHAPTPDVDPQSELSAFIVDEVRRQSSEQAIRTLVEKKIGEVIAGSVDSAFRSYGNVGRQIEKAVATSLEIGDRIDVPAYGNMVMGLLRAKMDEVLNDLVNKRLAAEMDDILRLAPKEVKLSDVVKALIESVDLHDRHGTNVTCLVEESESVGGFFNIYMDEADGKDRRKYECELQFAVDRDGKIYSMTIGRKDVKTAIVMGAMDPWMKMVFAAYCCGSKIIIDERDPSTGIGDF